MPLPFVVGALLSAAGSGVAIGAAAAAFDAVSGNKKREHLELTNKKAKEKHKFKRPNK